MAESVRPGEVAFERFEIERRSGSGAMGIVYRAKDTETGRPVALKVLHGTEAIDAERFEREAAVLASLRHPGIVQYVAHGFHSGAHYLAMEWLEGEDLADRLERQGLTMQESVTVVARTAEALAAAHASGIIHRDVKPRNLFLVDRAIDRVKILDFGIARIARDARGVTLTGAMIGTPGYIAPEQAQGLRNIDARADVFSLGCVLFKCLTGRAAFAGDNIFAMLAKTILEDAPRVSQLRPDVPEPLDALVARLLAKDPTARPSDAAGVAAELGALGAIESRAAAPASAQRTALTESERRVISVVLAGGPVGMSPTAKTLTMPQAHAREDNLKQVVESHGGRLDVLADGSLLVKLAGTGTATDQAVRAARCALEMRAVMENIPMAMVTGATSPARAQRDGRFAVGELIDRGVALLVGGRADGIRVDDPTAGLLDVRFDVSGDGAGLYLRGERDVVEAQRTLLGKPYPCVGRDRELALLAATYDECAREPVARAVLVSGPAGRGKSRVRWEFLRALRERSVSIEVLFGRGDSFSAGSPFGMLAPAIRRAAGILEGEPLDLKRRRLHARIARHVQGPSLCSTVEFLGELASVPFPDDQSEALHSARRNPLQMGDAMMSAWLDWLEVECHAQPVLLVLEDLHWGDLPTVRFVDAALGRLAGLPFMVLALARPEVHAQFPALWAEREVLEIRLGVLTPKASTKLAREALGEVDDDVLTQVVERSGGNAFYLEELIRAVAGGADATLLPETVLGMVHSRLDAVGTEAKRVLRAASVFGHTFWARGVAALLGGEERAAAFEPWFDELVAREIVAPRGTDSFPNESAYVFRHALLRDAAYATLTDDDRVLGHHLAGAWLERAGETDAMVLAEHFDRGREPARATAWYRRAAEHALEGNDFAAALERSERGIAGALTAPSGSGEGTLGALRAIQAEAHKWRGELAEAERRGLEALELLSAPSDAWFRALGEVIALCAQQGQIDRLDKWVEEASSITVIEGASAQVNCLCRAITALLHAGRHDSAERLMELVELVAGDTAQLDRTAAARLHQAWAVRDLQVGLLASALRRFEAALESFEQAGNHRDGALTRINVGFVYAELGDLERAEPPLRQARAAAERMGLENVAGWALNNLGHVLARRGALQEARTVLVQALEIGQKQGSVRLEVGSRVYLARVAQRAGDLNRAEIEARRSVELALDILPLRAPALAVLARVLLERAGEVPDEAATRARAEAVTSATEAARLLDPLGAIEGDSFVRLSHAEALKAAGDEAGARTSIALARVRILARADKIDDEALRESFLTRVAENARTLDLAAAWGAIPQT